MNRHSQQHITFIISKHKTIITNPKIRAPNLQITITKPNRNRSFQSRKPVFRNTALRTRHISLPLSVRPAPSNTENVTYDLATIS
ncbi:hypothetical protein Hanom_Chr06g00571101 [Helianthus anomalus]